MDPLRSDTRPAEALSGTEREAWIEQWLLAGLDEYFAHRYEHAISLWTRVLFLDRHHDRARAYIERARSAQAELLRESDALLQQGHEAFHAGDVQRARQLVIDALSRGASRDDAQGVLERIDRLGHAQVAPRPRRTRPAMSPAVPEAPSAPLVPAARPHGRTAAVLLTIAAVGVLGVGAWGVIVPDFSLWPPPPADATTTTAAARLAEPLPAVEASEALLARARRLAATGRLADALRVVGRIPLGDSLHPEAERLRATIQRELLAFAAVEQPHE